MGKYKQPQEIDYVSIEDILTTKNKKRILSAALSANMTEQCLAAANDRCCSILSKILSRSKRSSVRYHVLFNRNLSYDILKYLENEKNIFISQKAKALLEKEQ